LNCRGRSSSGQLGIGTSDNRGDDANEVGDYLPFTLLGTGRSPISLSYGDYHVCAILTNLLVKCWGDSASGESGQGYGIDIGDFPNQMDDYLKYAELGSGVLAQIIMGGNDFICMLSTNHEVKCWGEGQDGQFGYGDTSDRGDPSTMSNYLPFVNLGTGLTPIAIYRADIFNCILFSNNQSLKCWGTSEQGHLGYGDTKSRGGNANEMSDYLPLVNIGNTPDIAKIRTGGYNPCLSFIDDSMNCWGSGKGGNFYGQLGIGHANDIGDQPGEMGEYLVETKVGTGRTIVEYDGGFRHHSCVILDDFRLKCFGIKNRLMLDYGDSLRRGDLANQMNGYLPSVNLGAGFTDQSLHLEEDHTCVILNDNSFK